MSNVYIPELSEDFKFIHRETPKSSEHLDFSVGSADFLVDSIPHGIIDSWIRNNNFKELIKLFKIDEMDNLLMFEIIKESVEFKDNKAIKNLEEEEKCIIESRDSVLLWNIDEATKNTISTLWLDF